MPNLAGAEHAPAVAFELFQHRPQQALGRAPHNCPHGVVPPGHYQPH